MDNKSMLAVLNYILDELEACTNPSLIPLRLHELKMKLHTFIHDVSLEMAKELDPVSQLQNQEGIPAQAILHQNQKVSPGESPTGAGGQPTPDEANGSGKADTGETESDNEEEAPAPADSTPTQAASTTTTHRKRLFDRKKK